MTLHRRLPTADHDSITLHSSSPVHQLADTNKINRLILLISFFKVKKAMQKNESSPFLHLKVVI
jgi:hypothetical protein